MRFLIRLVIVVVLCLIAVGFFAGGSRCRGPAHNAAGDKVDVKASVNVKKMEGDIRGGIKKVEKKIDATVQQHEKQGDTNAPPKPGPAGQ